MDKRWTYVVPNMPLYAHHYTKDKDTGEYVIFSTPIVAFGCWFEDGYNLSLALMMDEDGCLVQADESINFVGTSHIEKGDVKDYLNRIKWREEDLKKQLSKRLENGGEHHAKIQET